MPQDPLADPAQAPGPQVETAVSRSTRVLWALAFGRSTSNDCADSAKLGSKSPTKRFVHARERGGDKHVLLKRLKATIGKENIAPAEVTLGDDLIVRNHLRAWPAAFAHQVDFEHAHLQAIADSLQHLLSQSISESTHASAHAMQTEASAFGQDASHRIRASKH